MIRVVLLLGLFLLSFDVNAEEKGNVYLLAKIELHGTTYSQIVLFSERDVDDVPHCEEVLKNGLMGHWEYFGHYMVKAKWLSADTLYRCIESEAVFSKWNDWAPYRQVVSVKIEGSGASFSPYPSYEACLSELRARQPEETTNYFCGLINQKVRGGFVE